MNKEHNWKSVSRVMSGVHVKNMLARFNMLRIWIPNIQVVRKLETNDK